MKPGFLILITEGTSITSPKGNFFIEDFSNVGFTIDISENGVMGKYQNYIEKYFCDYNIEEPTFSVYPKVNDDVLDDDISDEINPDGVYLGDLENWIKSKGGVRWFRNYQLEKKLYIMVSDN